MYKLRNEKPQFEDGVVFYGYESYIEETDKIISKVRIIDDRNLSGSTLAKRRLMLKSMKVPLCRVKYAIFFLGDFIKLAQPSAWFIDSLGKVFNYKKQTRAKLKCYKIAKQFNIRNGGTIIEAEGISSRFKSLFPPSRTEKYVGILKLGMTYILYGYYEQPFDETWRLV